jgi:hypothetical protein
MQTERGKAFDDNEPTLSESEITEAHDTAKIVVSFAAKPRLSPDGEHIAYMAVKLALYDGSPVTVLFDRFSAETLCQWVQTAQSVGWKTDSMRGGPSQH